MENLMKEIFNKKVDQYSYDDDNYVAPSEITLTITLNEYRKLVSDTATASQRIKAAEKNKYENEKRITELFDENNKLKAELYELRKRYDIECGEGEALETIDTDDDF